MVKTIYILFFNVLVLFCQAQNLVLNPSFEEFKYCPEHLGNFNKNVSQWSIPNLGSTDYFNSCSKAIGFTNFFGNQNPKTGKAYAGMYVMAPEDYREYIQGEFLNVLTKGEKYTLSFYINLAANSSHAIKDLGVLFLNKPLKSSSDKVINVNSILNNIEKSHFTIIYSLQFYTEKEQWELVTFDFVSKGFEQFFIIGNFDPNKKLATIKIQESKHPDASYYYLDDISVIPFEVGKTKEISINNIENYQVLEENTVYTLQNVQFDFNKSNLLDASIKELDQLYNYLEKHKTLSIEIYGHTDHVGSEKRNEELSLLRAKNVALYLISKGLNPTRIIAQGFGDRFPMSSNNTDEGRALNRRVEFKLVKN
ncbi:OmpA family protein [Bizionia arctica]|uniref:OmpA-like domain-containing protein n=1 Tax=Bizionia arctica TaxID=1495645 RepID=A0A917GC53_9FLAO|nr:OmpA family protein [Bizionia arctica]GGG37727.1 hypothetical protein GCM10010976_06790 [Bizionia arctica]